MIKKSLDLTLKDKLSRLTYLQACKLLGENGQQVLQQGGQMGIDIEMQVRFSEDCFELRLMDEANRVVTITLSDDAQRRLQLACRPAALDTIPYGAALSLVLEEKVALGLAKPPSEEELPLEMLSEEALLRRAIALRAERAVSEKMNRLSADPSVPWTEYVVNQRALRENLSPIFAGRGIGPIVLFLPRFSNQSPGNLQAHPVRPEPDQASFSRLSPQAPLPHPADSAPPALRQNRGALAGIPRRFASGRQ
jgi:hypothetical protein